MPSPDNDATQPLDIDDELFPSVKYTFPGTEPGRTEPLTLAEMVEVALGICSIVLFIVCLVLMTVFGMPEPKREWVPAQPGHWEYVHPND